MFLSISTSCILLRVSANPLIASTSVPPLLVLKGVLMASFLSVFVFPEPRMYKNLSVIANSVQGTALIV